MSNLEDRIFYQFVHVWLEARTFPTWSYWYIYIVSRLKKNSIKTIPPSGGSAIQISRPLSSCPSTPPQRPRLPKNYKATPLTMKGLPQTRPPLSSPELRRWNYRDFSSQSPSSSPATQHRTLRDLSPSSDDSSSSKTYPRSRSRGMELYRRQQEKLTKMGILGTWMSCMDWWSDLPCLMGGWLSELYVRSSKPTLFLMCTSPCSTDG